jgi:hypothetical protein
MEGSQYLVTLESSKGKKESINQNKSRQIDTLHVDDLL